MVVKTDMDENIVATLNCGRPLSTMEIRNRISCNEDTLRNHIKTLLASGRIIKVKTRKRDLRINTYSLPEG